MNITLSNGHSVDIFVNTVGAGEPILFLHGGPGCCHDFIAPFFTPLTEHHQVIYYDQIGCGQSNWDIDFDYKIAYELEVIEAIRIAHGLDKITVVGESWGTYLGLQYASRFGQHIHQLILLSSVGYNLKHLHQFGEVLASKITAEDNQLLERYQAQQQQGVIDEHTANKLSQDVLNYYYLFDKNNTTKLTDQVINFDQNQRAVAQCDAEIDFIEHQEKLAQVDIYMYQGEADIMSAQIIAAQLVPQIKPTKFTPVAKCGHWIYLEQSAYINDEIARIIAAN
ncbi:alpha/beta fold hydrolase [Shewanella intestini]|uniref:Alpha/beta hydrolase n=1 Tax=Shewanella intestini TaxID=2017544 RepID=A0ABS5I1T7_9GAMM|nr:MULTISPECIES: alpha/beta hydrolase [Shewanella]MBR9727957.1 alpha/beta hydrolase [Shewanella intestini]MRG36492.1 alpha/beta fold hydrolase [Shewanella sp. XMDDZSB0408]